jgi:hypothetical protein
VSRMSRLGVRFGFRRRSRSGPTPTRRAARHERRCVQPLPDEFGIFFTDSFLVRKPLLGEDGQSKRVRYKTAKPADMPVPTNLGFTQIRCHGQYIELPLCEPDDAYDAATYVVAVKPLLNLSQTCFLSAILQALLHNPLWKQYYLSSGHDRKRCAMRRAKKLANGETKYQPTEGIAEGAGLGVEENGPGGLIGVKLSDLGLGLGECMNCEMDGAFAEVREHAVFHPQSCRSNSSPFDHQAYGGDSSPFGPITMLFAMWKTNTELAGYAQQGT